MDSSYSDTVLGIKINELYEGEFISYSYAVHSSA